MQPPPPSFPPQWGSSPPDPQQPSEPGYGGYDQSAAPDSRYQPPYAGYGAPPPLNYPPTQPGPGYAHPGYGQPGYGPPAWGGYGSSPTGPSSEQTISWIIAGVIGLLGLLGAILTMSLWINLSSAVSHAADVCNRFGGEYANLCRRQVKNSVPGVPAALVTYLIVLISGSLVATFGAVLLFFRKQVGQFLLLGGGTVMLVVAVVCEARYGATGRITYDLIAGLVIAAAGALIFMPAFRTAMDMPPKPRGGPPGGFPGSGHWPYGQPQPPPYGPPGPGGYPPQQW